MLSYDSFVFRICYDISYNKLHIILRYFIVYNFRKILSVISASHFSEVHAYAVLFLRTTGKLKAEA
jgi:hypothetical protein